MTIDELEKYIKRFPKSTQQALEHERFLKEFLPITKFEYEPLQVYRAVMDSNSITANDFIPTADERKMTPVQIAKRIKKEKFLQIGLFGTSVNEDLDNMLVSLKFPSERHGGIAIGIMKQEFGVADFEEGKTHHNWYIFQDKMDEVVRSFHKYR